MRKNFFHVDLIRVTAILLVVFLHTAGVHLGQWNKVPFSIWMIENVYDAFTRMSVPLFVMISGAMLLQKEESYQEFLKKRFMKIFIPAVVWIVVYIQWKSYLTGEVLGRRALLETIVSGPVYYHLWYLYMIVGLYLITPLLRKMIKQCEQKDLVYFIGLWFIFISIIPTVSNVLKLKYNLNLQLGIMIPFVTGHVGYYLLGYMLNQIEVRKNQVFLCYAGIAAGWGITTFGTVYVTSILGNFNDTFYSYFSPNVVLEAVSCFALLSYYGKKVESTIPSLVSRTFSKLGVASFGVYLVHPLIRDILLKNNLYFAVDTLKINPIISNPLATIETVILSYIVTVLILKIPILNLAVGGGPGKGILFMSNTRRKEIE